ncbi:ABC transporter substrate-binding protein (plasmid) [Rhizobium sp. NIBRBAC000502774]|nr:ABC transporter substrate-binding protein [Rhizobium sp. NIBRBAC000502774]
MSALKKLCLYAAAVALFSGPSLSQEKPVRPVTVAMGHQSISVGEELYLYAVPKQLGYFRDEGLDVKFEPTSGSGAAVQLVVGGRADMGQSNSTTVFNAIQKGADIRLVYNITPRYASGLAVLENSPIKTPADLAGKLVGVVSLATGRLPEAQAMVAAAGLKPEDVKYVAVGTGAQAATALSSGQVQALYLWDNAYAAIEAQGVDLRVIRDVFPGVEGMLDSLQFSSEAFLKKDPEAVAGFGRAAAKGLLFTIENPEAALELFYREYPDVRAKTDAAKQTDLEILKRILITQEFRNTATMQFGYFPPENVKFSLKFMTDAGQVQPGVQPERTYTNDFIAGANDFDVEAVINFAKGYQPQ